MKKDLKKRMEHYRKRGWKVELSKKGHYRWQSPDGLTVVISGSTISDYRGWRNHIATLKRVERTSAP